MLSVVIIASGHVYQRPAAFAAATYRVQMKDSASIGIYLPAPEEPSKEVAVVRDIAGVQVRHFEFRQVSKEKFVSQLKCQGFFHVVSGMKDDDSVLLLMRTHFV